MPHRHNGSRIAATVPALLVADPAVRRAHHARDGESDQGQLGVDTHAEEPLMRVLVDFGSKRGGTARLAAMFGAGIVAGALYANRWHRDARRFVRHNSDALRELPVLLVVFCV
jgi:hypothetical protein